MNVNLDALIKRIAQDDMAALRDFYNAMSKPVYLYALSVLHHKEAAEDVTQEAFLRIRAYSKGYSSHGAVKGWIFSIVRNLCIDELKRKTHDCIEDYEIPVQSDEDNVLSFEYVQKLLSTLREDEREIVTLKLYSGLSHLEISSALSLPYPQVRWKYSYALKKLKKHLEEI